MHRRNFILGMAAATFVASTGTVQARAWGANGYMTRRVREAEALARVAYNEGKQITDNPYGVNAYEFSVWAAAFNRAAYFGNMTPEEYHAYLDAEIAATNAELDRREKLEQEQQNNIVKFGLGVAGLMIVSTFIGAIFSTKRERDVIDASRPWEK